MNGTSPATVVEPSGSSPPVRPTEPFVVRRWSHERTGEASVLRFHYRYGRERFTEVLAMHAGTTVDAGDDRVRRLIDLLGVLAGVSYFKAFAPRRVEYEHGDLDADAQHLVDRAYDDGLREFAFHNGFDIPFATAFPAPIAAAPTAAAPTALSGTEPTGYDRVIVPFGGGKDSSLLAAALRDVADVTLFTVGHNPYVGRVADALGVRLWFATRTLDPRIVSSTATGYLNGHVPVTAINSMISLVLATAVGADAVVMANERSSSSDTVAGVNHQYSKSLEFERAVRRAVGPAGPGYFSALRPWGDLAIARAFANALTATPALLDAFMSCNRAFVRDPARRSDGWCGACDKCRSVFVSLAPFVERERLTRVFGHDLLDDPTRLAEWRRLVDADDRPFDCVADVTEARQAFGLLAADDRWRDASVVRAMVAEGATAPVDHTVFAPGSDHEVPPAVFSHLLERHFAPGSP